MTPTPAIVNLNDGKRLDPRAHLSDRWSSLQIIRIDAGETQELRSDGVEHALYILEGNGEAHAGEQQIVLNAGIALTMPLGTSLVISAGDDGIRFFHVVLEVGE